MFSITPSSLNNTNVDNAPVASEPERYSTVTSTAFVPLFSMTVTLVMEWVPIIYCQNELSNLVAIACSL